MSDEHLGKCVPLGTLLQKNGERALALDTFGQMRKTFEKALQYRHLFGAHGGFEAVS